MAKTGNRGIQNNPWAQFWADVKMMMRFILVAAFFLFTLPTSAETKTDETAIRRVVLDYIQSQQTPDAAQMDSALHSDMKKRTHWKRASDEDTLLETSRETMLEVARTYNQNGDRFPAKPRVEIEIFDIVGRTASVKLTADDWIDYMHLMKLASGEWKIINVLWQFHDQSKHQSKP